ncbi:MAG TPA: ATP/GTP-binding protein [Phnomibacter sp.]|nr:ATP/GTP-binding protein [Phnomibacter sp.]
MTLYLATNLCYSQPVTLQLLWQTDSVWKVPESVLYHAKQKRLYVSNIDGAPNGKDGKGSIGYMKTNGKGIVVEWITGLHAPKGMALHKHLLYVADLDAVAVIDVKQQKIITRLPIEGATFLNDISADPEGNLYVSDSDQKRVHKIAGQSVTIFADGFTRPNGVLWQPDGLFVLDAGVVWKISNGHKDKIAEGLEGATDGIERLEDGSFLVSCWQGVLYHVMANGHKTILADSRAQAINTADIGWNPAKKILYVPTFFKNRIMAYQVKP